MKRCEFTVDAPGRLDAAVKRGAELSNAKARAAVCTGKVRVAGERVVDPAFPVTAGVTIVLDPAAPNPARTEPLGLRLVFRDEHLLVVEKPSGLLSSPMPNSEEPNALQAAYSLCRAGRRPKLVHRLDKQTSGLLLFARGVPMARALRTAFDAHAVRRVYRCVVQGVPERERGLVSSMLVTDTGEGYRGSRRGTLRVRSARAPDPGPMPGAGKHALTRYEVVASRDGRCAMEVRLATGRTHQIRIHLSEIGCPVLGEYVYGQVPGAPRLALHAAQLSLTHPESRKPLRFESPWPADLADVTPIAKGW